MQFLIAPQAPSVPLTLFHTLKQRRGRVLFVCYANASRSQMAEAFARHYGRDVLHAQSAGFVPSTRVSRTTRSVMGERGLDVVGKPKSLHEVDLRQFDLIVNLSNYALPADVRVPVLRCPLPDPMGGEVEDFRDVRDRVEQIVDHLVTTFREAGRG